jgi:uncharacterized damage-inducible protein DinB
VSEPRRIETRIVPAAGFRSTEVAVKVSEIAAVHALLAEASDGLTAAQLERQPAPGRNTIGMLLAHVAVAETHLGQVGLLGERDGHVHDVIGITVEDEGMPLAPGAGPSLALSGRERAFFLDLLARAHAHTRAVCANLEDADLAADIVRPPRPDGTQRVFDRRYILFHMVEHAALHLGQIRALRAAM